MKLYLVDSATVNSDFKHWHLFGEGTFDQLLDRIKDDYVIIKDYPDSIPESLTTRQFIIVDDIDGKSFYQIATLNFLRKK